MQPAEPKQLKGHGLQRPKQKEKEDEVENLRGGQKWNADSQPQKSAFESKKKEGKKEMRVRRSDICVPDEG